MLRLHRLPAFQDNYIWVVEGPGNAVVVVDPGDAGPVLALLEGGRRLAAVLITHHHPDHIGGIERLLAIHTVPVYAPEEPRIPVASHRVRDGERIEIPAIGIHFDVLEVPGHTRSHVAYFDGRRLFCGDTLFSLGCGRMFEGTARQMLASLDRLAALPPQTEVCCTHEYTLANAEFALHVDPSNPALRDRVVEARAQRASGQATLPCRLVDEIACNPFLRVDSDAIRTALAQRVDPRADRVERFAALRAWKDGFRS